MQASGRIRFFFYDSPFVYEVNMSDVLWIYLYAEWAGLIQLDLCFKQIFAFITFQQWLIKWMLGIFALSVALASLTWFCLSRYDFNKVSYWLLCKWILFLETLSLLLLVWLRTSCLGCFVHHDGHCPWVSLFSPRVSAMFFPCWALCLLAWGCCGVALWVVLSVLGLEPGTLCCAAQTSTDWATAALL